MLVVVNICKCWRGWNEISGWNPVLLNNRRAMASIWSPAPIPGQSRASSGVTWGELTKQTAAGSKHLGSRQYGETVRSPWSSALLVEGGEAFHGEGKFWPGSTSRTYFGGNSALWGQHSTCWFKWKQCSHKIQMIRETIWSSGWFPPNQEQWHRLRSDYQPSTHAQCGSSAASILIL